MSDTTNLWNIKKWYSYYSEDAEKLHQLGGELMKNENPEKTEVGITLFLSHNSRLEGI